MDQDKNANDEKSKNEVNIIQHGFDDALDTNEGNTQIDYGYFCIQDMACASCVQFLESAMCQIRGVQSVSITLISSEMKVVFDKGILTPHHILKTIEQLGYSAIQIKKCDGDSNINAFLREKHQACRRFLLALIFFVPTLVIELGLRLFPSRESPVRIAMNRTVLDYEGLPLATVLEFVLSSIMMATMGWRFLKRAYKSIRYAKMANIDVLIAVGILLAYGTSLITTIYNMANSAAQGSSRTTNDHRSDNTTYSSSFEAVVFFISFVLLARYFEALAQAHSFQAIAKLLNLKPSKALLLTAKVDSSNNKRTSELEIDCNLIQVGDIIKVHAGGKVPVDGEIIQGTTNLNEFMFTGEYRAVMKTVGDHVIGGTINLSSMIWIRATRIGHQTTLHQIIELVHNAQALRAPMDETADRMSRIFVPIVLMLALIDIIIWLGLGASGMIPSSWLPTGYTYPTFALFMGFTVLAIACPCAIGLASPAAVMVGTGTAARYGMLIRRGGVTLQKASKLQAVIFRKTGILTLGRHIVFRAVMLSGEDTKLNSYIPAQDVWRYDMMLWKMFLKLEKKSSHPIANAIVQHARGILSISSKNSFNQSGVSSNLRQESQSYIQTSSQPPSLSDHSINYQQHENKSDTGTKAYEDDSEGKLSNFIEVPGKGVRATIVFSEPHNFPFGYTNRTQLQVVAGSEKWMYDNALKFATPAMQDHWIKEGRTLLQKGKSVVYFGISDVNATIESDKDDTTNLNISITRGIILGLIAVADPIRPEVKMIVRKLKSLGIQIFMLADDDSSTNQAVANQVGIDHVFPKMSVQDICKKIRHMQRGANNDGSNNGSEGWNGLGRRRLVGRPASAIVRKIYNFVPNAYHASNTRRTLSQPQMHGTLKRTESDTELNKDWAYVSERKDYPDEDQHPYSMTAENQHTFLAHKPLTVGMVGDRIKDSLALTQADVGIALSSITNEPTLDAADVSLLHSNLADLYSLICLSKRVVTRIKCNYIWAFGYNIIAIPFAAGILFPICGVGVPPALASLFMLISCTFVLISSSETYR